MNMPDYRNIYKRIDRQNKNVLIILLLCLELLIGWGDYITGPLNPFAHIYLLTIISAGFFLKPGWAYCFGFLSAFLGMPVFQQLFNEFRLAPVLLGFSSNLVIFLVTAFFSIHLKEAFIILENLANEDTLTQANSRRYFFETGNAELIRAYRYQHPITLAYIDLDNFKDVNDKQGHDAGDQLLIDTAATIKSNLRGGDIFGRLGGDEFAILLNETDQEQAKIIMVRMRENLQNAIAPYQTKVTFSIGVVTYLAEQPATIDELIAVADNAMYVVKNDSKNAIHFVIA
jgi:diguanylate cyclase (GGDEF)-like protein